jgi:predicted nucleic acid-binding protein
VIRATWDTNALASGAIARQGVLAEPILEELERTLRKTYFRARLSDSDRIDFLALLLRFATVAPPATPLPTVLPDRADNVVLATAIGAGTPYVVSGDREMQNLGTYRDVRILSPREFLAVVSA